STLAPAERGSASWTLEGLTAGTHAVQVDIAATLERPGRVPWPMSGVAQAAVEFVDPRFHVTFSHPDTVRIGEAYSLFVTVTNLSAAAQQDVGVAFENLTGTQLDASAPLPPRIARLEPGASQTLEFRLIAGTTGKCVATTFQTTSEGLSA